MLNLRISFCVVACTCALSLSGQKDALEQNKQIAYSNPLELSNINFIRIDNEFAKLQKINLLLFDDWGPMLIYGTDSTQYSIDSANYHIEQDLVLTITEGQMLRLDPAKINAAIFEKRKFVSLSYAPKPNRSMRGYFEEILDGDYSLLAKHALEVQKINNNPLGMAYTEEEKVVRKTVLYYTSPSQTAPLALPSKKSDFFAIFGKLERSIEEYAGKYRISTKKEDGVAKLFAYANELMNRK